MVKRIWIATAGLCVMTLAASVASGAQKSGEWKPANSLIRGVQSSVSGPVRDMPRANGRVSPPREQPNPRRGGPTAGQQTSTLAPADSALQGAPSGTLDTVSGLDFEGIDYTGYYPPDTNIAVGNNAEGDGQVVETVNSELAVFDKATGQIEGNPIDISNLFTSLGAPCGSAGNGTDPIVLFDQLSNRWIVTQTADPPTNYRNNLMCIAVSQTSDATGKYYVYSVNFGSDFPDYPKLAVWPDGYYYSADMFSQNSSTYLGAWACAFNPADLDSGKLTSSSYYCFQGTTSDYRLLPASLYGSTQPPAGAPGIFLELGSDNASLVLDKLHAPWSNNNQASLTQETIPVDPFTYACGSGGTCVPQEGTKKKLDSLGDGLMYPLVYRNFGSYDALVVSQSVNTGLAAGNVGIRWYEIRDVDEGQSGPSVYQQSTYTGDDMSTGNYFYRWMGSIAEDQVGDLALGYSKSSSSSYPGISYTGQTASDKINGARNEMESEDDAVAGNGSETKATRWGDYSSMAIDPGDDCTFWYTNEYFPASGLSWNTRILSFNFPGCPTFSLSSGSPSQTIAAGADAKYVIDVTDYGNTPQTVAFSPSGVYGLPDGSGAIASFTPGSATTSGSVTLTISATSGLAPGAYPLYVVGTEGNAEKSVALTLVVNPAGGGNGSFSIGASSGSITVGAPGSATDTIDLASIDNFAGTVQLTVAGLPNAASASFSLSSVTLASGAAAQSTLTVSTSRKTSAGIYTLTVTGTSGVSSETTPITLTVQKSGKGGKK